jgi:hypothetical protein
MSGVDLSLSGYAGWGGIKNPVGGTLHRAVGPALDLGQSGGITDANCEEIARRFIEANGAMFRVSEDELRLLGAVERCGKWFVVFERYFNGVRVWDSRVDLRFTADGRVFMVGADTYPDIDIPTTPGWTVEQGAEAVLDALGGAVSGSVLESSELVVFPRLTHSGRNYTLAWYLRVWVDDPLAHYNALVDAHTGEILLLYDDIRYETIVGDVCGVVHPEHRGDPYVEVCFPNDRVEAFGSGGGWGMTDQAGHFEITVSGPAKRLVRAELRGSFVHVTNAVGPEGISEDSLLPGVAGELTWSDSNSIASERDGFYHTNVAHDYIQIVDPGFTLLDYSMPCEMNITGLANAYWDGYGMHYGAGGNDFGQHADVIYHEYGHGITDFQYRPRGPSGSMHEAFSDFYAATITDDSRIGEGVMAYRDLDNDMRSPENLSGESHHDGMIIGGALWHMRENLNNVPLAESLFHFARYGYPGSPSQPDPQNFLDYLIEVYVVDDDDADLTNGTPHTPEIAQAFGRHGIGSSIVLDSVLASDVSGTPDMFLDPGDTVQIVNWVRILQSMGFGANNAIGVISCADPRVEIVRDSSDFGDIPIVGTGSNSGDPFLFVVSDTLSNVIDVEFSVELLVNPVFCKASFEFVVRVGHPEVLLVDDDDGAPYEMFFECSLDSIGIRPYHWDNHLLSAPDASLLSLFPAVIWFTGDSKVGTLTDTDMLNLAQYLDSGGRLFLTGQNIGEEIGSRSFYSDYLKAQYLGPSSDDHILEGFPGDFIGDGLSVITAGSGGGSNQTSQDLVAALSPADTVFLYDDGPAGIKYDSGTFKTVYFSFGLEGVNDFVRDYDHRPIILKRILLWFGVTVGCDEECESVGRNDQLSPRLLQNAPNPFVSSTAVRAVLPGGPPGKVSLTVHDVSGRVVRSFDLRDKKQGEVKITWDGRDESGSPVPSGVYFWRLRGGDFTSSVKMVKLKR